MREIPHLLAPHIKGQLLWFCLLGSIAFSLAGCSSFRGPGEFKSPDAFRSESNNYQLLLPEFRGPTPAPTPRSGEAPIGEGPFVLEWPVQAARLTQKFRPSSNPSHQGIDLAGSLNSPILSAHDGIIVYAGRGFKGYGKMILVEYNHMWATLYAHLNRYKVNTGEWVTRGQLIGLMGRTGRVSGVHLHFELLKDKQPVDPLSMLRFKGEVAEATETQGLPLATLLRLVPDAECNRIGLADPSRPVC